MVIAWSESPRRVTWCTPGTAASASNAGMSGAATRSQAGPGRCDALRALGVSIFHQRWFFERNTLFRFELMLDSFSKLLESLCDVHV
ncbi:MAG TPA: hypothetical protein DEP84_19550 [Chloroflexi bacterium]|nr:hypothetical protein [Chloroflexota bacterium]